MSCRGVLLLINVCAKEQQELSTLVGWASVQKSHAFFTKLYNYFYIGLQLMCFFKNLPTKPAIPTGFSKVQPSINDDSSDICMSTEQIVLPAKPQTSLGLQQQWMLLNCMAMVQNGSQMMACIDQKLSAAEKGLEEGRQMLEDVELEESTVKRQSNGTKSGADVQGQGLFKSKDKLIRKLFGTTEYKYKLVLNGQFSPVLYKERNFSLEVKLVDIESGNEVLNGNIVNVCIGACEDNGEWISETKEGITFLKGKIESELYHGSAGFAKMAARDVSRCFANKIINLVVYPKPTVLKYSGESSIEENIDFSLIEPLMVHGVSVKAKKRD